MRKRPEKKTREKERLYASKRFKYDDGTSMNLCFRVDKVYTHSGLEIYQKLFTPSQLSRGVFCATMMIGTAVAMLYVSFLRTRLRLSYLARAQIKR